jgi:hypothetical protein
MFFPLSKKKKKASIRKTVLTNLPASPLCDFPPIIKFLLNTADKDGANELIRGLREHVSVNRIGSTASAAASLQPRSSQMLSGIPRQSRDENPLDESGEALIVRALLTGFKYRPFLGAAYIKELQKLKNHEEFRALDMWILFIVRELPKQQRPVLNLLRNKTEFGVFPADLHTRAIEQHGAALTELLFFSSISLFFFQKKFVSFHVGSGWRMLTLTSTHIACPRVWHVSRYFP